MQAADYSAAAHAYTYALAAVLEAVSDTALAPAQGSGASSSTQGASKDSKKVAVPASAPHLMSTLLLNMAAVHLRLEQPAAALTYAAAGAVTQSV